jgi:hypothetical protein
MSPWQSLNFKNISIVALLTVLSLVLVYYFIKTNEVDGTIGWTPLNAAPEPFTPGVVLDGRPPADFEIVLVKPEPGPRITAKAATSREFVVLIKMKDEQGRHVPPTFVKLKTTRNSRISTSVLMSPSEKNDNGFMYSCMVKIPRVPGDYSVVIEAEYAVFNSSDKKSVRIDFGPPESYRKTRTDVLRVTR